MTTQVSNIILLDLEINSDLDLEVIPLTYDNALVELKRRNNLIKRLTGSSKN